MTGIRVFIASIAALAFLPLGAIGAPPKETLVSLRTGVLPPVPDPVSRGLSVDGRLVALGAGALWVLDTELRAWTRKEWRPQGEVIGVAAGYGPKAFLLLGSRGGRAVEKVEALSLESDSPRSQALPPLPMPLAAAQGAQQGDTLLVAGTADGASRLLAINPTLAEPGWVAHAGWPGGAGEVTSMVAQTGAVFITLNSAAGEGDRMLRWKAGEGWTQRTALAGTVVEATARPIGQAHVLYLVRTGADGAPVRLAMFHTITGSWATLGEAEVAGARAGTAFGNGIAWARPATNGAGTELAYAEVEPGKLLVGWLDWFVIAFYLVSMLGMGLYFYLREKRNSTSDFFVGGRTIPFWAVGISLYAANTSSISYIAIPAKAFETNWQYLTNNLVGVLGLMFVAVWIVPVLRRLDLMSVFHYIETRFHPVIRTLASALYIVVQIGSRMSVILFLPSLAIATMTGLAVEWSILIMGVFTMIYTALGGMKAVVWTDFVQLIVKMGGIGFAIGFVILALDGGAVELFRIAAAEDKMKLFDFRFDLTKATVWGFIFLVLFDVVLTFPKDQVLMQRVLSTKNSKDAGRSIWTFAAVTIPGGFMFYFVGTALYAFYKTHPERMNPLLTIDATFPLFIAAELPMGIKGLIIAGILAAAMATLSSIMNSVATLASVDFYEKIVKKPSPKISVRFAEAMTVVTGLLGMGVALLLSRYDIHSLFDISIELFGVLGGGFAGVYTLGMFTRRANWQGVAIGVAVSILLTMLAWSMSLVHPYFYLAISILLCIVVGYCASWLFPAPTRESLKGLTIHEPRV
jgi:SSS family solute:Na+ symporter